MIILFILEFIILFGFLWFLFYTVYWFIVTPKIKQSPIIYKKSGFIDKVFKQLPEALGKEFARRDKDSFNAQGMIVFTGRQGAGKTISMIEYASTLKATFPECKVLSNFECLFSDKELSGWRDLVNFNNGKYGVVACIDEISLQFNARNFKNFNADLIQTITQNRKNRRVILGTAQNLSMVDKYIRLNCTEQRKCFTIFGVITFVVRSTPDYDCEGNLVRSRFKGLYWFVHSDFLRDLYDTYSAVEKMTEYGFKEVGDFIEN